eukprot:gene5682-20966_t
MLEAGGTRILPLCRLALVDDGTVRNWNTATLVNAMNGWSGMPIPSAVDALGDKNIKLMTEDGDLVVFEGTATLVSPAQLQAGARAGEAIRSHLPSAVVEGCGGMEGWIRGRLPGDHHLGGADLEAH